MRSSGTKGESGSGQGWKCVDGTGDGQAGSDVVGVARDSVDNGTGEAEEGAGKAKQMTVYDTIIHGHKRLLPHQVRPTAQGGGIPFSAGQLPSAYSSLMREWSAEQEVTFLKWPPNSSDLVMVPGIRFSPGAPCNPYNISNPASICILSGRQQRLFLVRISNQTPQTAQTLPIPLYHFGSLMLFWQSVWVPHQPALTTKKKNVAESGWKQAWMLVYSLF